MKLLLFLFISSLLVSSVMNCLVVISDCPCQSILDLAYIKGVMEYTEKRGCIRNMTCPIHWFTKLFSLMDSSELPEPSDVGGKDWLFTTNPKRGEPPGTAIDMFAYFGIICEDKSWFVTKYPTGALYTAVDEYNKPIGSPDEYNGKKSMIRSYTCWDPDVFG